jgi:hypothetical protein
MLLKSVLLLVVSAAPALANTIVVNNVDTTLGEYYVNLNEKGTNTSAYWAGGILITVDGYSRSVFCVQLFTDIYLNTTYTTTIDFSDTANLKRVGWLLQNEFPVGQVAGAAFQLAVWDIIEDNGDGFGTATKTAGTVSQSTDPNNLTSSAVLTAAVKYEADSLGKTSDYGAVYHNYLGATPMQNLMGTPVTDGGPSPAPEPSAIFLMIGGLALIGLGRLRIGRRG